jgi:uncharacterized protein (DUF952 family)
MSSGQDLKPHLYGTTPVNAVVASSELPGTILEPLDVA